MKEKEWRLADAPVLGATQHQTVSRRKMPKCDHWRLFKMLRGGGATPRRGGGVLCRPGLSCHDLSALRLLRIVPKIILATVMALATVTASAWLAGAADVTTSGAAGPTASAPNTTSPPANATGSNQDNAAKARALVAAAINMTDSNRAVALLWQATDLDPTLEEAYVYLGLYYNSRSEFDRVVPVYQKLVKYHPNETSAWLNIGEAYLSFSPPRYEDALPYYRKALELDSSSSIAALRIGMIYAEENNRDEALHYLRLAAADRTKNPEVAEQAERLIHQIGP
jgi:Tfp pilus assembly protein PilF